jgi:hypothetical protein
VLRTGCRRGAQRAPGALCAPLRLFFTSPAALAPT